MEYIKTNIALIPKTTRLEKAVVIFIVLFIFVPFVAGLFAERLWLLLSVPVGFLMLFVFNRVSKGKFQPKNWVQKEFFVAFTLRGVSLMGNAIQKDFLWSEMEESRVNVEGFDGETRSSHENSGRYTGTENTLVFLSGGVKYEFNFYLRNAEEKEALKSLLDRREWSASQSDATLKQSHPYSDVDPAGSVVKDVDSQKRREKIPGWLIVFAVPFVLIGIATLALPIYQLANVTRAKDWSPVNAKILSMNMIASDAGRGVTYKIEMDYQYTMGSDSLIGNDVSFNAGLDNIEHYHELYDKLSRSEIIEVYVNEGDPTESVVVKGVTNAMISMLIFSFMWNSLLLTFALPVIFRGIKLQKVFVVTAIIWVLAISKFAFSLGDIDISKQVSVVEWKGEQNQLPPN